MKEKASVKKKAPAPFFLPLKSDVSTDLKAAGVSGVPEGIEIPPLTTILKTSLPFAKISSKDLKAVELPKNFDPRTGPTETNSPGAEFVAPPRGQGTCGSCWAFAIAGCIADVFTRKLLDEGEDIDTVVDVSPASVMVSTWKFSLINQACCGGVLADIVVAMAEEGLPVSSSRCVDESWYVTLNLGTDLEKEVANVSKAECVSAQEQQEAGMEFSQVCDNYLDNPLNQRFGYFLQNTDKLQCYFPPDEKMPFYTIKDAEILGVGDYGVVQRRIQEHIYEVGSVLGGFSVSADILSGGNRNYDVDGLIKTGLLTGHLAKNPFASWENGVDKDIYVMSRDAGVVGGHAIGIIGWGYDKKLQEEYDGDGLYWIIRNSWGPDWGNSGFCKMAAYPVNEVSQFSVNINGEEFTLGGQQAYVTSGISVIFSAGTLTYGKHEKVLEEPLPQTTTLADIMNKISDDCKLPDVLSDSALQWSYNFREVDNKWEDYYQNELDVPRREQKAETEDEKKLRTVDIVLIVLAVVVVLGGTLYVAIRRIRKKRLEEVNPVSINT